MNDAFVPDEDNAGHLADDMNLFVIEGDERGLPMFACFFKVLYQAFTDEQLAHIPVPPGTPDDEADSARRVGAALCLIADNLAYIIANTAGEAAEISGQMFNRRVAQSLALMTAPAGGAPN
jgi:hypothetical protein